MTNYCTCTNPEPEEVDRGEFYCEACEKEMNPDYFEDRAENAYDQWKEDQAEQSEQSEQEDSYENVDGISYSQEMLPNN